LRSVFELIRESRSSHPLLCTKALVALLDVVQGQQPEGLKSEPTEVIGELYLECSILFMIKNLSTSMKMQQEYIELYIILCPVRYNEYLIFVCHISSW
jgi:hypothetical protein